MGGSINGRTKIVFGGGFARVSPMRQTMRKKNWEERRTGERRKDLQRVVSPVNKRDQGDQKGQSKNVPRGLS